MTNQNYTQSAPSDMVEKVVYVNPVSKKTKGGNNRGFSVLVVVGDRNGQVGVGLGKGVDVSSAMAKGIDYAKKHLVTIERHQTTIPHDVRVKRGAAEILLKPAPKGSGIIAGAAIRAVVEAAGITDISSKVLGTNNKASNVYACFKALISLKPRTNTKTHAA